MSKYYDPADVMRHHPIDHLSDETIAEIGRIKASCQILYNLFGGMPQSADMTLAKRRVEEACMWAVKAVTA